MEMCIRHIIFLIVLSFHFGACRFVPDQSPDYDYAALETETLLAGWNESVEQGGLSVDELDRLNLHVRAIFAHRCFQCHSTAKHKGALILDDKEGVFAGGDGGPVVIPGQPRESELLKRVQLARNHDDAMPPEGAGLSSAEIKTLHLWIEHGAHWTDADLKIFREAEMALIKPSLDALDRSFKNPIDQWVNAYFEEREAEWPDQLADRQFIRKVYLDIIGLLPSPEEIETFVTQKNADKRIQLIDHLLSDQKNYTEHWLSFWNDLLRNDYSGTGFITKGRKQISQWLYQSLYDNMPYDSFVRNLVNPTEGSEGFIQGIKWRGTVNASQSTELQAAQNISQSLLGVNLKCASCHNSFINNVTLQQAYDFAQIFVDSTLELYRCDKPTGRFAQPAFLYPELGEVIGDSVVDRLESLAQVITQPDNGRLYRTLVNRYWDRLMGRGLIAPVDEMDNAPWSQELLDWIAAEFRDQGYDIKWLIRSITSSQIYQSEIEPYDDPYQLRSSKFVFRGPVAKRMTAEQISDAFSQLFAPLYHSVAFDPDTNHLRAHWIWHRQVEYDRTVLPYPGKRFFRKKFQASPGVQRAEIIVAADHEFGLYLNNSRIGDGQNWENVYHFDVSANLQADNVIAIEASNDGVIPNPAGVLLAMKISYSDGYSDTLFSDQTWLTFDSVSGEDWKQHQYVDTAWSEAWEAGSSTKSHWGKLRNFTFGEKDATAVRAALVKLDPFLKGLGRPVRENIATQRDDNATLLQSLLLTNDHFFSEAIQEGAAHWLEKYGKDRDQIIPLLWKQALGRLPEKQELNHLTSSLSQQLSNSEMEDLIWSVLLLPEFQFI